MLLNNIDIDSVGGDLSVTSVGPTTMSEDISTLQFQIQHPIYFPDIDTTAAKATLDGMRDEFNTLYTGDAETLGVVASNALQGLSTAFAAADSTNLQKEFSKKLWDGIKEDPDKPGAKTAENFVKDMDEWAGSDPAKQKYAAIAKEIAAGISGGDKAAIDELVTANMSLGLNYPEAMLRAMEDYLGIHSPSTVARDRIGAPIGEGILQGMRESLGLGAGVATDVLSGGVGQGAETVASLVSSAMGSAISVIDAAVLAIGTRWTALKDSLIAAQKLLWAGMKEVTTAGLADQELALTVFMDSWKNVKNRARDIARVGCRQVGQHIGHHLFEHDVK